MSKKMWKSLSTLSLALLVTTSITFAASLENAQELFLAGDLEATRAELSALLEASEETSVRAAALRLLGQLEIQEQNWSAALDAWGELTDHHAVSADAVAVSAAIRPLQALVDCGCAGPASVTASVDEAAKPQPGTVPIPSVTETPPTETAPAVAPPGTPAPAVRPVPVPMPAQAQGRFLIGTWGSEYAASEEVTEVLREYLENAGVEIQVASTEIPAIRGEKVVLSFLVEEARKVGASGILFVTTRFGYRDFVRVESYDTNGVELWADNVTGGTALKDRHERGKVAWSLVERMKKKLSKRLGSSSLPTQ